MGYVLVRKITRRNPFSIEKLPLLARIYKYPFDRYSTVGKLALFGAPNMLAFYLYQRLVPVRSVGRFRFANQGLTKLINFDARNTQFSSIYLSSQYFGYEPQVTALLDALLPIDGVFLDVGSNWGLFSLFLASKQGFRGTIHAFEPFPSTFADLLSTVKQAELENTISCHNVALSDEIGESTMRLAYNFQSGGAYLPRPGETNSKGGVKVMVQTLDSLNMGSVSILKVDAEGSEAKVFRGGYHLLARQRPMIVFENSKQTEDVEATLGSLKLLRDLGYVFFHLSWLRNHNNIRFFVGDESDPHARLDETLALVPFNMDMRLLRQEAMNIFACHSEALPQLEPYFEKLTDPKPSDTNRLI